MNHYSEFLKHKSAMTLPRGFDGEIKLSSKLFPFQAECVRFALKRGRALLAEDCGLGKTIQELEWARIVCELTGGNVLILAPLAVAQQTVGEGAKFGIPVTLCRTQADVKPGINITNYEMLAHFDAKAFTGVVLDESSILKNFMGKIKRALVSEFSDTPYRLCCTATPAPNDLLEIGNHAQFLGIMESNEMISRWFINDTAHVGHYRLKGHAERDYYRWLASWAVMIGRPSDIGFDDGAFNLPALKLHRHVLDSDSVSAGFLFQMPVVTLKEQRRLKRLSLDARTEACARIVNGSKAPWVVWGELNDECDALEESISGATQVAGGDSIETKEDRLTRFAAGAHRVMVSKPSIAGYGLNWQHCNNMAFVHLTHSYEDQYQAIRRCWRFGQTNEVNVHFFIMDAETAILDNIERKRLQAHRMADGIREHMAEAMKENMGTNAALQREEYAPRTRMEIPKWLTKHAS